MRLPPLALHLGIAALVTAPLLAHPLGRLLGSPDVDVWNHAWGPWWWATSLAEGGLPWRTHYLAWPHGGVLWFIDPVLALLGAPLTFLVGPAGAYNAAVFAMVAFASWSGRRLARAFGASELASWVGALALAASAWVVAELHNGITEAADVGPVALALAWTEEACTARTRRAWARAGAGVGLAALASPYLGLGAGIAALVRGLPQLHRAWAGGLVALLLASPPALLLRGQLLAPDAVIKHPAAMNEALALHNAVDPRTFVAPLGFRSVDLSAEGFEHTLYLGIVTLLLALLSPRRSWWPALLASLLFALGPYLYSGDGWVLTQEGMRLRLPWWLVREIAPGLAVSHPLRLGVPALAIAAGLAASGAGRLPRRAILVALVAVPLDGLVLSGAPWPLATAPAEIPPVFAAITRQRGAPLDGGVLDLPTDVGATMATSRYLFWQTSHQRPIPYAPDVRASTSSLVQEPSFRALAALSPRRPDEQLRLGLDQPSPGGTHPSRLLDQGLRWIVVHRSLDPEAAAALEVRLAAELGPGREVAGAVIWDLQAP